MLKYLDTTYPHHLTSNTWTTWCKWHVNIGKFPGRLCFCGNPLPTDCLHNVLVRALPPFATDSSEIFWPLIHTMRNLFSLTSNAIWPIMTKSRSPKSVVRVEMSALETRNACYFTLRPAFPLSEESISVFESQNSCVFILPGRQGACFCRFNRAVVW